MDPTFYIVGLNYFPFPGTYPYLAGNGRVSVSGGADGLAHVDVCTNGGGAYSHHLVLFLARTQSIRLGYTTVYFHVSKRMWELYTLVPMLPMSYNGYSLMKNHC